MPIEIVQADNRDCPGIVHVVRSVYDEFGFSWDEGGYHSDLYDVESAYPDPERFWVARVDGEIVATVGYEEFERIPGDAAEIVDHAGFRRVAGTDCSLERLYVHPNARRLGLGRMLTEVVIERARSRSRTAIELWSDKRFHAAHRLYESFGAITVGERICDDPDEAPEWGLYLALS